MRIGNSSFVGVGVYAADASPPPIEVTPKEASTTYGRQMHPQKGIGASLIELCMVWLSTALRCTNSKEVEFIFR